MVAAPPRGQRGPTARAEGTGRTKRPAEDGSGDTVLAIQQSLIVTHRDGRDSPILPMSANLLEATIGVRRTLDPAEIR